MITRALLTASLILNPYAAYPASPKEQAAKAIETTHKAARLTAKSLVRMDIDALLLQIMSAPMRSSSHGANILNDIKRLEDRIQIEIDKADSVTDLDATKLQEILKGYRNLVRERFSSSFKAQTIVYDREQAVRNFELFFKRFNNLCRSGRSADQLTSSLPELPRIPEAQYGINLGVNLGSDWGSGSKGSAGTSLNGLELNGQANSTEEMTPTSVATSGASMAVGYAWSGYMSATGVGASAAAMTTALATTGIALAVVVAAMAVAAHDQMLLENEMAQAEIDFMTKSANDRDIARYYQEYCSSIQKQYTGFEETLSRFAYSQKTRDEVLNRIASTRDERTKLKAASIAVLPYIPTSKLVEYYEKGFCVSPDKVKKESICIFDEKKIRFNGGTLVLDLKKKEDQERIKDAQEKTEAFHKVFPPDLIFALNNDEVMDRLLIVWNEHSDKLASISYRAFDNLLNIFMTKIQTYIIEVNKAKNSSWAQSEALLGPELKYQQDYTSLRTEYFKYLNQSILVVFNRVNANDSKTAFANFRKRFESFASNVYLNKDVQSLSRSVKSLGVFYETL